MRGNSVVTGIYRSYSSHHRPVRLLSSPFSAIQTPLCASEKYPNRPFCDLRRYSTLIALNPPSNHFPCATSLFRSQQRAVSTKQRRKWKVRKYHFKLRLKRTMRKMRVPYVSSKSRGQVKKKPILYDFRPYLRRKLKRAER